jgi:ribosome-binding protein aMBF1 (putative translation factor)
MKKIFNYSLFEKAMHRNGLNAFDFSKKAKIQSGTVSNWKNVKDIKKIAFRESIERILGVKSEESSTVVGVEVSP